MEFGANPIWVDPLTRHDAKGYPMQKADHELSIFSLGRHTASWDVEWDASYDELMQYLPL